MTITLFPFDDDASYSSSLFPDAILRALIGDDPQNRFVLPDIGSEFALSGVASPIAVGTGVAFINGKFCESDAEESVNIPTPAAATRIDVIALEVDYVNKTKDAAIVRVAGEEGGAEPALTWTPGTKCQAKLGTVTVTTGGVCTCTNSDVVVHLPIADDQIDDTKVGNRVPQFYRRQGGNATNWATIGATGYTPAAVRMQAGAVIDSGPAVTVTFPIAFSAAPLVFIQPVVYDGQTPNATKWWISAIAADQFTATFNDIGFVDGFNWLAIGPE